MDEDVGSGVLGEIRARLAAAADAAQARGESLLPPLLILGTSERVGSNWVSDTLRPVFGQHNEPFRQQLGPDHPWSALNPCFAGTSHAAIGPLGRHWLVSFAVAKYGPVRQAVKETNLFFALPTLLAVLPGAPVLVLSRSPLGVASSFMRGDLFRRWGYRSRYQQMIAMTRHGDSSARRLAVLVPDDDPADLVALVRLHVLNTVLLADALDGRGFAHIAYETAVTRPGDALATLTAALPELGGLTLAGGPLLDRQGPCTAGDDTFATTTHKTVLVAGLENSDAGLVHATTAAGLGAAQSLVPAPVAERAASWLAGRAHDRQRWLQVRRRHPGDRIGPQRQRDPPPARQPASLVQRRAGQACWRPRGPVAARHRVEHSRDPGRRTAASAPAHPGVLPRCGHTPSPRRQPTAGQHQRSGHATECLDQQPY